jgi:general secretion pathway protein L
MNPPATLIQLLPPSASAADAPLSWWLVDQGRIVESGVGATRPTLPPDTSLIGLAPAGDCPVDWISLPAMPLRQAQAAARLQAATARIDGDALHRVAGQSDSAGRIPVASVSPAAMERWNTGQWHIIVPAALLLDDPADCLITLGEERIARLNDRVIALTEDVEAAIIAGRSIPILSDGALHARLSDLAQTRQLDLLTGPYAPARPRLFDAATLRKAAVLVGVIILVSLAIGLTRLARIHADIARIDDSAASAATTALGRMVDTNSAITELDARMAAIGVSQGSATATLAALLSAMETHPAVALDGASWNRTGTLTITLSASRNEEMNPVLLALQANGYRITYQTRTGSDGRALADLTVRARP